MKEDKKQTIAVATRLLTNIYSDIQTPEVIGMLLELKEAEREGNTKPIIKVLRSVRRDITEIIDKLKED